MKIQFTWNKLHITVTCQRIKALIIHPYLQAVLLRFCDTSSRKNKQKYHIPLWKNHCQSPRPTHQRVLRLLPWVQSSPSPALLESGVHMVSKNVDSVNSMTFILKKNNNFHKDRCLRSDSLKPVGFSLVLYCPLLSSIRSDFTSTLHFGGPCTGECSLSVLTGLEPGRLMSLHTEIQVETSDKKKQAHNWSA